MHRLKKAFSQKTFILWLILSGLTVFIHTSCLQNIGYVVTGKVTKVLSGDTFQLITPAGTYMWIRLYGIDAPETYTIHARNEAIITLDQPYGDVSLKALEGKILGHNVDTGIIQMDRHNRLVGIVWMKGRNINLEMISEGHAEVFMTYLHPPYRAKFLNAQAEAKAAGRGIWSLPNYERPIEFRKRLKTGEAEE